MKKLAAGIALALAAGGAYYWKQDLSDGARGADAETVTAAVGDIEDAVEATGSVAPLNRVELKPPIGGRVERLLIEEGGAVRAGQVVAWMSSSDRAAILDAARARGPEELARWEDAYKPTPVIAPLSGIVILRNVVVGQTVDPNTVLYAMSDSLIVLAQVDESEIGRIRVGMPARITLDAYPDRVAEGSVFEVLHEGKNVSNVITYGVKVRPREVPPYFRSQMTANVRFILSRTENAVLLPMSAVREGRRGRRQVALPTTDGQPELREIRTGVENGESVEVLEGVKAGETVLLAHGRYRPQRAPDSSPLAFGGGGRGQGGSGRQGPVGGEGRRQDRRSR